MIFDNLPDVSDAELEEIVVERFRELRAAIFSILPSGCLLRPKKVLSEPLAFIDVNMINSGLIEREDICSFCPLKECPYNYINDRDERIKKIIFIGNPVKRLQ